MNPKSCWMKTDSEEDSIAHKRKEIMKIEPPRFPDLFKMPSNDYTKCPIYGYSNPEPLIRGDSPFRHDTQQVHVALFILTLKKIRYPLPNVFPIHTHRPKCFTGNTQQPF